MAVPENPYASPLTDTSIEAAGVFAPVEVEEVRRKYLSHEASVRSVGALYYISGTMLAIVVVGMVVGLIADPSVPWIVLVLGLFYLAMAVLSFALGAGLRRLDGRVRIPVVVLSVLGLLWLPIGTLINAYVLYLMLSAKGAMVFSPYYREIIAQTPHIKYRTSIVTWILLIFLLVVIVGSVVAFLLLPMIMQGVSR